MRLTFNPYPVAEMSSATILKVLQVAQIWWKYCPRIKQLGPGWDAELLGVASWSKLFA